MQLLNSETSSLLMIVVYSSTLCYLVKFYKKEKNQYKFMWFTSLLRNIGLSINCYEYVNFNLFVFTERFIYDNLYSPATDIASKK